MCHPDVAGDLDEDAVAAAREDDRRPGLAVVVEQGRTGLSSKRTGRLLCTGGATLGQDGTD